MKGKGKVHRVQTLTSKRHMPLVNLHHLVFNLLTVGQEGWLEGTPIFGFWLKILQFVGAYLGFFLEVFFQIW